jgi:hypothetical protein
MAIACLLLGLLATASIVFWHKLPLGFTAVPEALLRTLTAIAGAGLVLMAAAGLGRQICHYLLRWSPEDWREAYLYQTATGLGALAYLALGLASIGSYSVTTIRILIAISLLSNYSWFHHLLRGLFKQRSYGGVHPLSSDPSNSRREMGTGDRAWKMITGVAVLIALICALAPETEYDALWYHLGLPKLWLEHGYLVDLPTDYVSLYPMTWELVFGFGLALGGAIAAKLLHFSCLLLTGLLVYQLAWRFMPNASPWLAVACFVTVPIIVWEASTAYIDLALALHVGLAIYAILRFAKGLSWQWFGLTAIHLGLALATKHLALFVLAITVGGLAVFLWLKERHFYRAIAFPVSLGLCSLLLPLPWYLRSWLASGNPVFPELFEVFGAPPDRWDAITQRGLDHFLSRFDRPHTLLEALTLPWDMTIHAAYYGGTLGPVFLLLLPALLLYRRSPVTPWLFAFVALFIGLWASPFSSTQMRFLVPIAPLLALLAAEAYARLTLSLDTLTKYGNPVLHWSLVTLLIVNLPPFTPLHEVDRAQWNGWLTHVIRRVPLSVVVGRESQEAYLTRSVPSYAAWRYINTHLPLDARILTFSGGDHFYSDRDRLWSDATLARPATWGATKGQEQQALQKLQELRISHILFDKQQLASGELSELAIAQPVTLSQWYDLEHEDDQFILYRLQPLPHRAMR